MKRLINASIVCSHHWFMCTVCVDHNSMLTTSALSCGNWSGMHSLLDVIYGFINRNTILMYLVRKLWTSISIYPGQGWIDSTPWLHQSYYGSLKRCHLEHLWSSGASHCSHFLWRLYIWDIFLSLVVGGVPELLAASSVLWRADTQKQGV